MRLNNQPGRQTFHMEPFTFTTVAKKELTYGQHSFSDYIQTHTDPKTHTTPLPSKTISLGCTMGRRSRNGMLTSFPSGPGPKHTVEDWKREP